MLDHLWMTPYCKYMLYSYDTVLISSQLFFPSTHFHQQMYSFIVFTENESPFSPVSQVHYQYYSEPQALSTLTQNNDIQCIVGNGFIPFGSAQTPSLTDYADGTDTMAFLQAL